MFAKRQEGKQLEGALACSPPAAGEDAVAFGGLGGRSRRPPLLRQESICLSPRKGVPAPVAPVVAKPSRDPHTGKGTTRKKLEFGKLNLICSDSAGNLSDYLAVHYEVHLIDFIIFLTGHYCISYYN